MPSISADIRTFFWVIAAIAGVVSAIIGNELAKNVIYWLSRRGRPPANRPLLVWIIFFSTTTITIFFGALAANAPASPKNVDNILVATVTPNPATSIPVTLTNTPIATTTPVLFRVPEIRPIIKGLDSVGYSKQSSLVRDSQGQLTLFVRDSEGNLGFLQSSDSAVTWSEPTYFYQMLPPGGPSASAAIDSADQIHVVWGRGPEPSDVHYGLLIDQTWNMFDAIVGTGSFARDIAVDSANHPHIVWSGIGISRTSYNGTNWLQPPEQVSPAGWHPDIQIDAKDKILLFFNDAQFYATPGVSVYEQDNIPGHWNKPVKLSDSPFWSGGAAAALDSEGNIYVTWIGTTTEGGGIDQVFFSRFIGGVWQPPFPVGNVNTSAGSTGQESPAVAFDSNDVFYVFWRGLNSDNHPVIFARALVTDASKVDNVTQGWSPEIELLARSASNAGWPSVADVWREYRQVGVDLVWPATVGKDVIMEYAHFQYP